MIATYEMATGGGAKARNTEILTFRGDRVFAVEVYFGWNVP